MAKQSLVVVESENETGSVSCFQDWHALLLAHRIARELALNDPFSPLALEGLALELTAVAMRRSSPPAEDWLEQTRALVHDHCQRIPTVAEIATELKLDPALLARSFRARYGESLGEYARRRRLDWTAAQLLRTDTELATLAVSAGFVDQSHFTHAFRNQFGITPARFRAAFR